MAQTLKIKCPWCGFSHLVPALGSTCRSVYCPIYRESFKVVYESIACLACGRPCPERKVTTKDIEGIYDPALRGILI